MLFGKYLKTSKKHPLVTPGSFLSPPFPLPKRSENARSPVTELRSHGAAAELQRMLLGAAQRGGGSLEGAESVESMKIVEPSHRENNGEKRVENEKNTRKGRVTRH